MADEPTVIMASKFELSELMRAITASSSWFLGAVEDGKTVSTACLKDEQEYHAALTRFSHRLEKFIMRLSEAIGEQVGTVETGNK